MAPVRPRIVFQGTYLGVLLGIRARYHATCTFQSQRVFGAKYPGYVKSLEVESAHETCLAAQNQAFS